MDPAAFGISALAGFLLGAGGAVTVAGAWVATSRKALLEQVRQSELTTQLVQERSGEAAERALSGESAVQRMATKAAELEIELANTREAAGRLD